MTYFYKIKFSLAREMSKNSENDFLALKISKIDRKSPDLDKPSKNLTAMARHSNFDL